MTAIYERTDRAIRGLGLSQSWPVFIGIHMLYLREGLKKNPANYPHFVDKGEGGRTMWIRLFC